MIRNIVFILLLSFLITGCIKSEISGAEKDLLLSVDDFGGFGIVYSEQYLGDYSKSTFSDGSTEIKYKYDPSDDLEVTPFYLVSTIEVEMSENEAKDSFRVGILAYQKGSTLGGATVEEVKDFIILGDQTYFSYLKNDEGDVIGNIISIRRGTKIISYLIVGTYFDDPVVLGDFLAETLHLIDLYK